MCKELWVSALAGKTVKGDNDSATKEHSFCNYSSGFDNFFLLASNNSDLSCLNGESFN